MFHLTHEERQQLSRGDGNISKELKRKKELLFIIREELKIRKNFDDLALSSYEDDGSEKDKSTTVTQRLDQALVERRRYFSINPPTRTRTLSLPTILNSPFVPQKTYKNNSTTDSSMFTKTTNTSNKKFPSLAKKQSENVIIRKERSQTMPASSRHIHKKIVRTRSDSMVRPSRALTNPFPFGTRKTSRSSLSRDFPARRSLVTTWKYKLHKRRYQIFS